MSAARRLAAHRWGGRARRVEPAPADARHYCVGIFDNKRGGTVIGAAILRDREAVFDLHKSTITFVDKDCGRATPYNSYLQDSYSFSCPAAAAANNSSGKER